MFYVGSVATVPSGAKRSAYDLAYCPRGVRSWTEVAGAICMPHTSHVRLGVEHAFERSAAMVEEVPGSVALASPTCGCSVLSLRQTQQSTLRSTSRAQDFWVT
ncbi:unnamed protein product [Cercospora beticola]|nr:unnamed protein product [Cercospora beticola]